MGERSATMTAQANALEAYWNSPGGATAYFTHANRCIKYYDTLKDQAAWLGSEGKKAGQAIDDLQLEYARVGAEYIDNLITKLKAYLDAADSFSGSVDQPAKALASALSAMGSAMLATWQEANNNATATLQLAQTAHDQAPDLGDATHRAQPFPSESGTVPYTNATQWKPESGGPPSITGS